MVAGGRGKDDSKQNRSATYAARSSRVVRASASQCRSRNCPGFDPNIREIWGAVDEAVLNIAHRKKVSKKIPLSAVRHVLIDGATYFRANPLNEYIQLINSLYRGWHLCTDGWSHFFHSHPVNRSYFPIAAFPSLFSFATPRHPPRTQNNFLFLSLLSIQFSTPAIFLLWYEKRNSPKNIKTKTFLHPRFYLLSICFFRLSVYHHNCYI